MERREDEGEGFSFLVHLTATRFDSSPTPLLVRRGEANLLRAQPNNLRAVLPEALPGFVLAGDDARRVDESKMGESLRKIAQLAFRYGVVLFR